MKKFVLIDGNAILYRAFHALPPLTNKDGVMTNAVYGFFSMLLKIIEHIRPTHIAVCFDRPKPTFRQTLYAGYQAQRPKMADELTPQVTLVHELLDKLHIKIFEMDGYEADDLIGTLASQAVPNAEPRGSKTQNNAEEKVEVIIVSGDRDLLQLVNFHVKMLAPVVGMTQMTLHDAKAVEEKLGVKPSQIVDYKALVGDASDNYPGVSGIGPKTAKVLLQKYGTFENLYEHIGELSEKLQKQLAQDAEQASLCKKLATIVTDAPVHFKKEECSMEHLNKEKTAKVLEEFGFKSLGKRLREGTQEAKGTEGTKQEKEKEKKNEQLGLL